jgi:hypothetical protein
LLGLQSIYKAKYTPDITGKFDRIDPIWRNIAQVFAVMISVRETVHLV